MSNNQPWRGRGWGRKTGRRGRGREFEDEECAPYLKKVRPATLGDAVAKSSSSSPPSSERQPSRSEAQPTRAAMPSIQPGRGWGGGGGGRGQVGDVDESTADSGKGRQPILEEHAWPALRSSSSSSENAPVQTSLNNQPGCNTDTADSKQGRVHGMKLRPVKTTRSQSHTFVVTPKSQPGCNAGAADSEQGCRLLEGKLAQDSSQRSPQNTSPPLSTKSTPRSQSHTCVVTPKSQPRGNADEAASEQGPRLREGKLVQDCTQRSPKNTSTPSSSAKSTPRSQTHTGVVTPNSNSGGNAGAADSKQGGRLSKGKRPPRSPKNTSSPSTPRFTAPREQEIVRQTTPSSGSGGTPPLNQSMKSESSSGKKLSYIGVVEKGSDPDKRKRLFHKLTMFLTDFKEDGGAFPYYRAELEATKLRSPFSLTVHFNHMISYDIELAFETYKCQGNMQDWLLPAACNFLKLQKYGSDSEILCKTQLKLSGFPFSMKKVTDVLQSATYSLELLGECQACEAKSENKLVIQLFFTSVFSRHIKDLSWDGQFGASDMWLLNNVELHICKPCIAATLHSRLRDVQKGGTELLPYFKGSAGYPAYFAQLEEDIQDISINQIAEPWCVEYFSFHMASLPSIIRRNLELALHYISKNIAIELGGLFGMITLDGLPNWQEYVQNSGCEPLKQVLTHIDPITGQQVKYENTIGGLVKFKRHFLEHVIFGKILDINEVELFGAKKFSKHLPRTVKLLLQRKKMVACFGAAWSSVKSSRFDARDTPVRR